MLHYCQVYRPRSPDEMCGNTQTIAALSAWLGEWKQKRGRGRAGDDDAAVPGESDDGEDSDEVSAHVPLLSFLVSSDDYVSFVQVFYFFILRVYGCARCLLLLCHGSHRASRS